MTVLTKMKTLLRSNCLSAVLVAGAVLTSSVSHAESPAHGWMDKNETPERRTELLLSAMTLEQKFQQVVGQAGQVAELPHCYGARHVPGLPELSIPTLRITNGPVGVGQNDCVPVEHADLSNAMTFLSTPHSAKATALPSAMAVAASFDPTVAE